VKLNRGEGGGGELSEYKNVVVYMLSVCLRL
jgi:hypothetical protein